MAVRGTCPGCGMNYRMPDSKFGKTVRCKECDYAFVVGKQPLLEGRGLLLLIGGLAVVLVLCGVGVYFVFFHGGPPVDTSPLSRANFNKVNGGMSEAEVEIIFGKPDFPDLDIPKGDMSLCGDKGRLQEWKHDQRVVTVLYCDHKVVRWVWSEGHDKDEKTDPNYALSGQVHH